MRLVGRARSLVGRPWGRRGRGEAGRAQFGDQVLADLEQRVVEVRSLVEVLLAEVHATRATTLDTLARTVMETGLDVSDLRREFDRLDAFVNYHGLRLRGEFADLRNAITPRVRVLQSMPGLDIVVLTSLGDVVIPSSEIGTVSNFVRHGLVGYESGVRTVIARHLSPGDMAVDVGANIGVMTLSQLVAVGRGGRVVAFEPSPHVAAALEKSVVFGGWRECCDVRVQAVGDRSGTVQFIVDDHSPMSRVTAESTASNMISVPITTLDAALPDEAVAMVKVDVEGYELPVWRGSRDLRSRNPAIAYILEWSMANAAQAGNDLKELRDVILEEGFTIEVIADDGSLSPLPCDVDEWRDCNVYVRRPGSTGDRSAATR